MNTPLDLDSLDASSKLMLKELQSDGEDILHVDPSNARRRAAAITLASIGLAELKTFERKTWELSLA